MTNELSHTESGATKLSIWRTPLRFTDLIRGRIHRPPLVGKRIAAAGLPAEAAAVIARVVRRTRLWPFEKLAVADELIAHFADGSAAGSSTEDLIHDFGDERLAAKLIRRATKRKRPLWWHGRKWATRGMAVLIALYGLVFVRYWLGEPTIRVDYFAKVNAPIASLKEEEKAWPIYRRAIVALDLKRVDLVKGSAAERQRLIALADARPGDKVWPERAAWLDAHDADFDALKDATTRPAMGILRSTYVPADPDIGEPEISHHGYEYHFPLGASLYHVMTPALYRIRDLSDVVAQDTCRAAEVRDGERFERDVTVLRTIARHLRGKMVMEALDSTRVDQILLNECLAPVLQKDLSWLSDARLIRLAHLLPQIGGETTSTIFSYDAERMAFYDLVQRIFTDDGHGDGRITPEGVRGLTGTGLLTGLGLQPTHMQQRPDVQMLFGLTSIANTRANVLAEFDEQINFFERNSVKPAREMDWPAMRAVDEKMARNVRSPLEYYQRLPLAMFAPFLYHLPIEAERLLGRRDGVAVGIALELYRRRHGSYPATLAELSPDLLPRVPTDRIDGEPLKYRLVNGKPTVYSVGVDGDDDGGRAMVDREGRPEPSAAAGWPMRRGSTRSNGDWVVFGDPTNAVSAASTQRSDSGVNP